VPEHGRMPKHEQYETLCALAAGGLLEGAEFIDFQAHMRECSGCRSDYQELSILVTQELPKAEGMLRQKIAEMRAKPLPYARQRFLRRARSEGVIFSREVESAAQSAPRYFRPVTVLAPAAALMLVAISLTVYRFRETPDIARAREAATAHQIAELKLENSTLAAQLQATVAKEQHQIQDLRAQLGNAATSAENLRRNSEQARGEASRSSSQNAQLLDESRKQEQLLTDARDEAARDSQLRISDEASLVEQQAHITELSNKLRIASATLQMERQLAAAGKNIPELIAARQLHVIDVRDTDPNGNASQAFGRVFLIEGKSLIFYVFDLNDVATNAKRSFQVWGVQQAGKNPPRSLGFLRVDDRGQGRLGLKVENPELVKEISSVFVTIEPAAGSKEPSGQKMLYAYLGEANHP